MSYSETFNLTLSECRQLHQAGIDLETFLEEVTNQPEWLGALGGIKDVYDIKAIQEGGCASGAFMPAVTYHKALEIMNEHGDDVLDYIEESYGELPQPQNTSWAGMAVYYVSLAVEMWVGSIDVSDITDY